MPVYDEYVVVSGAAVPDGVTIDLSTFGFEYGCGVALGPDGESLYYIAGNEDPVVGQDMTTLVHTDLTGSLIGFQDIGHTFMEDIDATNP